MLGLKLLLGLAVLQSGCTTAPGRTEPTPAAPAVAAVATALAAPSPEPTRPGASAVDTAGTTTTASAPPQAPAAGPAGEATAQLLRFHERTRELPPAELAREISRLEARLALTAAALVPATPTAPATPATPAAATAASATPPASAASASLPAASADPAAVQTSLELALLLALQRQNGDLVRAIGLLEPLQRAGAPAATQPLARLLYARLAEQRRLEDQLERQAQSVRELQRRADQLAAQLEALRAIERSLNTRPAVPATPATPAPAAPR